jgi:hypothetical protein
MGNKRPAALRSNSPLPRVQLSCELHVLAVDQRLYLFLEIVALLAWQLGRDTKRETRFSRNLNGITGSLIGSDTSEECKVFPLLK